MEQVEIRGPILFQDSQCVAQLHKEAIHFSSELKHTFTYNEDDFLILYSAPLTYFSVFMSKLH